MAKIYLTKEWLEKLQNELNHLKTVKRLEIAEKLKEAISFWDLSENSEYEDARNEQAQIEHRIASLEEQLKDIEIIEEWNDNWEKVSIWTIVEIENLETKEKEILKIVLQKLIYSLNQKWYQTNLQFEQLYFERKLEQK